MLLFKELLCREALDLFSLHKRQGTDLGPGCQLHSLTGLPHCIKLGLIRTKVNLVKSKVLMMRPQKDTNRYICN